MLAGSQVRASDEERERTCRTLREHYAAGRLTSAELEERVGRAYEATTRGNLYGLLVDLPSDRGRRVAGGMRRANRAALRAHAASYAAVNGGLVAVWGVTGGGGFWPGWSMAWWGAFLGWHWMASRAVGNALSRGPRRVRAGRSSRVLPR
ncbi:MAG: hypothetical protein QOK25_2993 [Thermoleophilaceae bacterium]|nr:hypothetical protein [Thermoleophilaceae bacterium]